MNSNDADRNRQVVLEAWRIIAGEMRLDAIDRYFAENFVRHAPEGDRSRDEYKSSLEAFYAAFPNHEFEIEDAVAEGDKVVYRWRFSGVHVGAYMGIPPTNKLVTAGGITITRIEDGRFVEEWACWNSAHALHGLGIIPIDVG